MAQTKSGYMPETNSEDIEVLRVHAAHEDGGGGLTVSGDALYDDDTPSNDLNALAVLFGVEYPEAYPKTTRERINTCVQSRSGPSEDKY